MGTVAEFKNVVLVSNIGRAPLGPGRYGNTRSRKHSRNSNGLPSLEQSGNQAFFESDPAQGSTQHSELKGLYLPLH